MDQFHYLFYMELPLIFPLSYYIHFTCIILLMINTFHQKVKKGQHFGQDLVNIVVMQ